MGMVPSSSLKEGKYNQMVEKRTKTTQQQTKQNQPQPTGRDSTTKQYFLCARVKQVRRKLLTTYGPEFTKEEHGGESLCSSMVGGVQAVAAKANNESLQVRVRKAHPPKGSSQHPSAHKGCQTGCAPTLRNAASLQKHCPVACKARVKQVRPWTYPSMVYVPLCTTLVMSDVNRGKSSIATLHHPPVRGTECRKQVGDSTQCLHISLDVASWRSAYAPFPPRKHCWPLVQVLESLLSTNHWHRPAKIGAIWSSCSHLSGHEQCPPSLRIDTL